MSISKEWEWSKENNPRIDENTVVKTDDGPEKGIPHFYVTIDDVLVLYKEFSILRVRHVDDCYFNREKRR